MMKIQRLHSLWILALTTLTLHAETQVINVDFGRKTSPLYSGQGAAGVGGAIWNHVSLALPVALIDSHSNATPVSVVSFEGIAFWQRDPDWQMTVKDAEDLVRDYWYARRSETKGVELGGIPDDWTFDLYVYSAGDDTNQGTMVTIGNIKQLTSGIEEPGSLLTEGKHYVVFKGLEGKDGKLRIEFAHNPAQPGEYGALNGLQMVVHGEEPVATAIPPTDPSAAKGLGMSSGLWVTIGFGLAVVFVVVLRLVMRPGHGPATTQSPPPELTESSSLSNRPTGEVASPQAQVVDENHESLMKRAEAAERRANAAETVVREGLMPEMKKVLKHKVVSHLVTEREELLQAQQQAAMDMEAFERRLTQMQAPVRDRLDAYEQRISDLEKELNQRGAENRELLKATIALARQKVEQERSRSRIDFN